MTIKPSNLTALDLPAVKNFRRFRILPGYSGFHHFPENLSAAPNQSKSEQIRPKSTYEHQKLFPTGEDAPVLRIVTAKDGRLVGREAEIRINRLQKKRMNNTTIRKVTARFARNTSRNLRLFSAGLSGSLR